MNLICDIETVGFEFESLTESQQEFLLRYIEHESDIELKETQIEEMKRYLSLYPLTARVIAIGLMNTETEKIMVYYENESDQDIVIEEKGIKYKPMNEKNMLQNFWQYVSKSEKVITFNGRNFDIPFLMIRSAMLQTKPSKNLMKYRYDSKEHIDLLDQLTFYGSTRKFNLDFYCHSFGIKSPKSKGITGMEVKELYKAGRIKEIAIYCSEDVKATYELYKIWNNFLNV
ncbi:MAG: ribonuclease H-like domain-containing protein [Melioribacter sp.]|nr:ribonuclease H-like domain-containing protein [Melioribacter sp.]